MAHRRMRSLHKEDHQSAYREQETRVAEPETVFWGWTSVDLLGLSIHPEIRQVSSQLLANNSANDDAQELQAELLRVESEPGEEELWDFNRGQDGCEEEDHGVRDSRNRDGGVFEE